MILTTELRVSKEPHSGPAPPQLLNKSEAERHHKTNDCSFLSSSIGMLAISSDGSQLLLLRLGRAVGRALQELEDLLHDVTGRGFRLATAAQDLPLPLVQNIKRDPFEQNVTPDDTKSLLYFGGTLAAPSTAFMYDGLG